MVVKLSTSWLYKDFTYYSGPFYSCVLSGLCMKVRLVLTLC